MRRIIYTLACFFLVATMALSVGCNEESYPGVIWDVYPESIYFTVVDEEGNDLLDPAVENNILEQKITITYKGQRFEKQSLIGSEDELPEELALKLFYHNYKGKYILGLGEFVLGDECRSEAVMIEWCDGSGDKVEIDHITKRIDEQRELHDKTIKYNGRIQEKSQFAFGKVIVR